MCSLREMIEVVKDESGSFEMGRELGLDFVEGCKNHGSIECIQMGRVFLFLFFFNRTLKILR